MHIRLKILFLLLLLPCGALFLHAAAQDNNASNGLLDFLNQTIAWYRRVQVPNQLATDPSDSIYGTYNRNASVQTVALIFDFARAQAAQMQADTAKNTQAPQEQPTAQSARLAQLVAAAQDRAKKANSDLDALQSQYDSATGKKRALLATQISEQKSEVALAEARLEALTNVSAFAGTNTAGGLSGKINELERTVPEVQSAHARTAQDSEKTTASTATSRTSGSTPTSSAPAAAPSAPAPAASTDANKAQNYGIIGLASDLFALTRKLHAQRDAIDATSDLRKALGRVRDPLIARMREVNQRGEQLTSAPESNDPAVLADRKAQLDALTAEFKRVSAVVIPLGKSAILLDSTTANLVEWRSETERDYGMEARTLLLRLSILAGAIIFVVVAADFWRRAAFRYIREVRRRSQFMLLRRIVVTIVISLIIVFALANEIGSLATFAGFITAGIAVALQNVILSVAAYFFLIGRYGIRVGDRVQIGTVTGDVVDIGLIRLHLIELDTTGGEAQPTGRVVIFSNSVVFQPTSNFFKQLPGSNFGWRRIALTLAADVNYGLAQDRISAAVDSVFKVYKAELDRQHRILEQSLTVSIPNPEPKTRLRLTDDGLEIIILYPVVLSQAASIDERMTHALLTAISSEPRLKLVGGGLTAIEPVDATPHS